MDMSVSECVELDRLNMTPILGAAGEAFDFASREARLAKSLATNGQLVGVWREGRLAGYAELRVTGDRCALWSVQVHPQHQRGPVLLGLLRRVAEAIDPTRVRAVASAVHASNGKSIRLYRLLGFREVGACGGKVLFAVGAAELAGRLCTAGATRAERESA